ncbi:hypothetical protein A8709_31490 [Paenibacillus pectinilyticus]|uniref:DUF2157 domain-containing protein n=1 Tax=Paenibacillus pectinilyticus TaxID=512399 RepID=A0A1C0ZW69_9BACL|nr:GDYXXLXY domain-containing protein [Paenibacillus pectinilyticus]OCT12353.1 hypothetical protein A8709_31490 [Paenibacillus pectinilyticus]
MKSNQVMIQLGYVLGASALLTAIGYFFASNWEKLNRLEKFIPIFVLILGFYGLSVWLSRQVGRDFLSKLSLFASCISFGFGIGLIGQTYNSHADSYSLFLVWFLPAILYAILTKWQPYYVLSYLLGHLTYGLFFFPKWGDYSESEGATIAIWLGLAIVNTTLFVLFEKGRIYSPFLKWVSFQVTIGIFLIVSFSHTFEKFGLWMNLPLIAVLALAILYAHRTQNKMYLLFAGLWVSAAIIVKYIEVIISYHNELFFIVSLLFIIVFIGANVMFMNYVRAWQPKLELEDRSTDVEPTTSDAAPKHGDFSKWIVRVLSISVIIIGSLLGSVTLIGLFTLVFGFDDPNIFIGYGLLSVIGMLIAKRLNSLARFTILISGLMLGTGASVGTGKSSMLLLFLVLTVAAFVYLKGLVTRILFYLASVILVAFVLFDWVNSGVTVLSILSGLLFLLFAGGRLIRQQDFREPILYSSYPSFLLTLFSLTFIIESGWYYVTNVLFFLLVFAGILLSRHLQIRWMYAWSMSFWIAFLVYKYYDVAWKLLHKSISFAIIGLLILGFTIWFEKKKGLQPDASVQPLGYGRNRWIIALLVLLQVGAMLLQIGKSEYLLSHGKLIKLQLQPLDPRSLIQGDYVRLRYTISEPPIFHDNLDERTAKGKIAVVLAPKGTTGVYEFLREYHEGESLATDEVRLNGNKAGYEGIDYGIETFFVPEGTGRDYEHNAKFAEVKVSASGDAILVRLTDQ